MSDEAPKVPPSDEVRRHEHKAEHGDECPGCQMQKVIQYVEGCGNPRMQAVVADLMMNAGMHLMHVAIRGGANPLDFPTIREVLGGSSD